MASATAPECANPGAGPEASALAELNAMISRDNSLLKDASSKEAADPNNPELFPRPDMETGIASRLSFLMWAKFDPDKAFRRRKVYWEYRAKLFKDSNGELPKADDPRVATALALGVAQVPLGFLDRLGRQVIVVRQSRVDYSVVTPEQVIQAFWYLLHTALSDASGDEINSSSELKNSDRFQGIFVINNLGGVERKHVNRTTITLLISSIQDVLPVRVGGVRIMNQPWFFSWIWSMISPFLSAKLRSRIILLGTQHDALLEWLEPTSIPPELGGLLEWDHAAWLRRQAEIES
jgi:hypothetical protein